jgi:integrase
MASVALLSKNPCMAHALLAFAGLLRVGEIIKVKLGHFTFLKIGLRRTHAAGVQRGLPIWQTRGSGD